MDDTQCHYLGSRPSSRTTCLFRWHVTNTEPQYENLSSHSCVVNWQLRCCLSAPLELQTFLHSYGYHFTCYDLLPLTFSRQVHSVFSKCNRLASPWQSVSFLNGKHAQVTHFYSALFCLSPRGRTLSPRLRMEFCSHVNIRCKSERSSSYTSAAQLVQGKHGSVTLPRLLFTPHY